MKKLAIPPNGDSYHHGDLRNALLQAALRLVAEKGAEGFSLREAAREVGVSPAAAYRHFEDKKALMGSLVVGGMGQLALAMERAVDGIKGRAGSAARAVAELAVTGQAYVEFAVRHPEQFQVMFGPWCDHLDFTEVPSEAKPRGRDAYQILVDSLDGLVRAGAITPAARAGAELPAWSMVHGLASLLVAKALPLGPAERAQATALTLRTLLRGLGCAPRLLGPAVPAPDPKPCRTVPCRR